MIKLTSRRAAILRSALASDDNVTRLNGCKTKRGFKFVAHNVTGDSTAQVELLLEAKLLEESNGRVGGFWGSRQITITDAGRAALAELDAPKATPATAKRAELVAAVRAHAAERTDRFGWSVIVETYTDFDIAEAIGRVRTPRAAIARIASLADMYAERQAGHDAEIQAAVGTSNSDDHYRVGGEYTWQQPGCACGREFASDKAADLHVVAIQKKAGTYEPTQQGHHADGSFVSWKHDEHSGDAWATRTYPGKLGRASIDIVETEEGYVTVERYIPGWKGVVIFSADHCDGDDGVPF